MSASPDSSLPYSPVPTPAAGPAPGPRPEPGIAPNPPPTPIPESTPGPLPLRGRGHPVASVEIIGRPVDESGLIGALHLAEVIHYRDGIKPDIVGYDPEGPGLAHGGNRLFAETSLGKESAEQYIATGRQHYHLEIKATAHQDLDEFVAKQEHAWKTYDRSQGVPRYDFAGADATYHNSNGAMIASIRDAGRADVAEQLKHDLEPPDQMWALQHGPDHLSPAAATDRLAWDRHKAGLPSAPGATHELTQAQVRGLATPEPDSASQFLPGREVFGAGDAAFSLVKDGLRGGDRPPNMLDAAPARDGASFTVMRTDAHGAQSLQRMQETFAQSGAILSADAERVTQSIGGDETFTYRTEDLLHGAHDRGGALRQLEHAAANHESATITLGSRGLNVTTQNPEHQRAGHPQPALHILHDGQERTVGEGHHQIGKIYNVGPLIGLDDGHGDHKGLTMYPKQELLDQTPPEQRAALSAALRDRNTVEIGIHREGLTVHDVTPAHQLSKSLERHRAIELPGHGLEL